MRGCRTPIDGLSFIKQDEWCQGSNRFQPALSRYATVIFCVTILTRKRNLNKILRLILDSGWLYPAVRSCCTIRYRRHFHHHLSACSLRIARTRTMVNIRNLIDDVKCFQTVRDLHQPRG